MTRGGPGPLDFLHQYPITHKGNWGIGGTAVMSSMMLGKTKKNKIKLRRLLGRALLLKGWERKITPYIKNRISI